jgi:hypothetical protein
MDFHVTSDKVIVPTNHEAEVWFKAEFPNAQAYSKMTPDLPTLRGFTLLDKDYNRMVHLVEQKRMRLLYLTSDTTGLPST